MEWEMGRGTILQWKIEHIRPCIDYRVRQDHSSCYTSNDIQASRQAKKACTTIWVAFPGRVCPSDGLREVLGCPWRRNGTSQTAIVDRMTKKTTSETMPFDLKDRFAGLTYRACRTFIKACEV